MISNLTKKQLERFPYYVKKWTEIGLSTESLDRSKVNVALRKLFQMVDKPAPKPIICTSPLVLWLTIGVLRNSVRDSVRDSVSDSVRNSVSAYVSDSVRDSVRDSVSNSVSDSVS